MLGWICALWLGMLAAISALPAWSMEANAPGPSAALFNHPYYRCITNTYVATTGSDSNDGSSPAKAWLTLQHANDSLPGGGAAAGTCVNVEPGTYAGGVALTTGGAHASSKGYVVYRCVTMDACTLAAAGWTTGAFDATSTEAGAAHPAYLIFDGFTMVSPQPFQYSVAVSCWAGNVATSATCHHWMVLDSVISGYGEGGIDLADGEYYVSSHNTMTGNGVFCDGQIYGSGLSYVVLKPVAHYKPAADDTNANNDAALNRIGIQGPNFPFHNVVAWNVTYNNRNTCKGSDTDGNGIIMDSFSTGNGNTVEYTAPTLVAFNVAYNNGGGGVHIFFSSNVTAANNTVYNNYLDPNNTGAARAGIDTNQSYSDTIINNLVVAIPAAPGAGGCGFGVAPYAQFNSAMLGGVFSGKQADVFSNNVTALAGGNNSCWAAFGQDPPTGENPMFNADTYSCTANRCATDPKWIDVGTASTGSEKRKPKGANFALQPTSPALGYGLTEPWLPAQSVDAGACDHTQTACPGRR
jgi:parallel beta-helix repeat protein